ncbi:hypothetical protein QYE76_065016 [Lolium multiflorum]|uniref:Non-specific lipid-transfer protein n=1 Tax=Lolium multiflorum TaxID=4521 RepID=A0AAD8S7N9_LOLMU|nr:hypothetical protein QYE76_065016 [Lolium multiflorum]
MAARRAYAAATLALLAAALVLSAAPAEGAVSSCGQVIGYIAPCLTYAMGNAPKPSGNCCSGVQSLNSAAASAADRQTTCNCLKQRAGGVGGLRPDLIAGIPGKCNVKIPYAISPNTDCSKVH